MKQLSSQCIYTLLVSIGLMVMGVLPNPFTGQEFFLHQGFIGWIGGNLYAGAIIFAVGYWLFGATPRIESWKFVSYVASVAVASAAIGYWGPLKLGIGELRLGNAGMSAAFVFGTFAGINIIFWRMLCKLSFLRAYAVSLFMSLIDMLVCIVGIPMVK